MLFIDLKKLYTIIYKINILSYKQLKILYIFSFFSTYNYKLKKFYIFRCFELFYALIDFDKSF